jgi:Predicted hydrolases or acyltransferases (alpha/beta hydrolase superfamily)
MPKVNVNGINMNYIQNSELVVFDGCCHAPMYEKTEEYNQKTLDFLRRHAG